MANIYQKNGQSLYDDGGKTYDAKTAQVVSEAPIVPPALATPPNPVVNTAPVVSQSTVPSGWDAQTYQNFKNANPNLEPDAEDTRRMQGAGIVPQTTTEINKVNTGNSTIDANTNALVKAQNDLAAAGQSFSNTITGISSGSIPLSSGDQAQVDALKKQFEQLISQQQLVNTGAIGTANIRGAQRGALEYDMNFQVKTIGTIATAGAAKIANLQVQEAGAIAQLTAALKENNAKMAKQAFDAYQNANEATQEALKTTIAATQKAIADAAEAQAQAQKTYYTQIQKPLQDISMLAAKYGAPPAVLQQIGNANSVEEAISLAGVYMQDPKAKFELEAARLDNVLKQAQINKTYKETSAIGQPTAAQIKANQAAQESAKATIPVLQDKLTQIDSLINSPGLAGSVGPNTLARSSPDFNFFTGVRQNFIAGVEQLVSKDTLDTLLALKAQGGTLGALSEGEGRMLASAATKIGTWAIKDSKGNIVGYNASEPAFKEELSTIKNITQRALDRANGVLLPMEDQSALNAYFGTTPVEDEKDLQGFQPANYY